MALSQLCRRVWGNEMLVATPLSNLALQPTTV